MARPSRVQVSASWVWNNIKTQKTSRQSPHDCGCLPANELQTLAWCFTDSQGLWSSLFKLFVPHLNRSHCPILQGFSCLEFLFKVLKDTFLLVCLFGLWDQNVVLRSEIVKCSLGWYAERCAWKQGWSLLSSMFPDWVKCPKPASQWFTIKPHGNKAPSFKNIEMLLCSDLNLLKCFLPGFRKVLYKCSQNKMMTVCVYWLCPDSEQLSEFNLRSEVQWRKSQRGYFLQREKEMCS